MSNHETLHYMVETAFLSSNLAYMYFPLVGCLVQQNRVSSILQQKILLQLHGGVYASIKGTRDNESIL